jgi:hypothetical protein
MKSINQDRRKRQIFIFMDLLHLYLLYKNVFNCFIHYSCTVEQFLTTFIAFVKVHKSEGRALFVFLALQK